MGVLSPFIGAARISDELWPENKFQLTSTVPDARDEVAEEKRVAHLDVQVPSSKRVPDWPGTPPPPIMCSERNSFIELCSDFFEVEGVDLAAPRMRRANSEGDLRRLDDDYVDKISWSDVQPTSTVVDDVERFLNLLDSEEWTAEASLSKNTAKVSLGVRIAETPPQRCSSRYNGEGLVGKNPYEPKWVYGSRWPFNRAPTTLVLGNLPPQLTQVEFVENLDRQGFSTYYDFVHVPVCFTTGRNFGYGIVNATHHRHGQAMAARFHRFAGWRCGRQRCDVKWALPLQGLEEHVEKYRNHPSMHPMVSEHYRPMCFVDGWRTSLPEPSQWIAPPYIEMS